MTAEFKNPYSDFYRDQVTVKVQTKIPANIYNRIKVLRIAPGTTEATLNLLWAKLIDALNERNITTIAEQRQFEHFVANSILILPPECGSIIEQHGGAAPSRGSGLRRVPPADAYGTPGASDDRGTVTGDGLRAAHQKGLSADPEGPTHPRGGGGKRRRAKRKDEKE